MSSIISSRELIITPSDYNIRFAYDCASYSPIIRPSDEMKLLYIHGFKANHIKKNKSYSYSGLSSRVIGDFKHVSNRLNLKRTKTEHTPQSLSIFAILEQLYNFSLPSTSIVSN